MPLPRSSRITSCLVLLFLVAGCERSPATDVLRLDVQQRRIDWLPSGFLGVDVKLHNSGSEDAVILLTDSIPQGRGRRGVVYSAEGLVRFVVSGPKPDEEAEDVQLDRRTPPDDERGGGYRDQAARGWIQLEVATEIIRIGRGASSTLIEGMFDETERMRQRRRRGEESILRATMELRRALPDELTDEEKALARDATLILVPAARGSLSAAELNKNREGAPSPSPHPRSIVLSAPSLTLESPYSLPDS